MPQLKSGRHVALSISPYLDALTAGSDESKYAAILALRLSASSPQALRDQVVIGYFREGQGTPPDAPSYPSGYCVGDVLEGRSDWSPEEVAELRAFLDEPRIVRWLQEQWDEIDEAIRNSPVWEKGTRVDEVEFPSSDPAMPEHGGDEAAAATAASPQYWQPVLEADEGAESLAGMTTDDDRSTRKPDLPDELRDLILSLARRPDVHSVSCPFRDTKLWEGLLREQLRRAQASGQAPQEAFFLAGPDSGIPGVAKTFPGMEDLPEDQWFDGSTLEERLGGKIHIPYEGVSGADLFIYPDWRKIYPEAWQEDGADLDSATAGKPCNHLLIEQDLAEPGCATRVGPIAGSWWLYSSKAPYKDCHRMPRSKPRWRPRPTA